jgi:hypothetical protein
MPLGVAARVRLMLLGGTHTLAIQSGKLARNSEHPRREHETEVQHVQRHRPAPAALTLQLEPTSTLAPSPSQGFVMIPMPQYDPQRHTDVHPSYRESGHMDVHDHQAASADFEGG